MDRLANRLKQDADSIEVTVSEELEHRITSSLHGITPERVADKRRKRARPLGLWWASSLTGIAAAAAVITLVNLRQDKEAAPGTPSDIVAAVPVVDWQAESAALTGPLREELENLQSDLRKAEQKVREDIGL